MPVTQLTVMISSTALDLPEHRKQAIEACQRMGMLPVMMETLPALPEPYIAHPYTLLQTRKLIGRREELNLLTDWVTQPQSAVYQARILNVVAIGGMGKSALTWVKYEIDKATGYLVVDRPRHSSSQAAVLYDCIPRTVCGPRVGALCPGCANGDGDPLDISVISERPIPSAVWRNCTKNPQCCSTRAWWVASR